MRWSYWGVETVIHFAVGSSTSSSVLVNLRKERQSVWANTYRRFALKSMSQIQFWLRWLVLVTNVGGCYNSERAEWLIDSLRNWTYMCEKRECVVISLPGPWEIRHLYLILWRNGGKFLNIWKTLFEMKTAWRDARARLELDVLIADIMRWSYSYTSRLCIWGITCWKVMRTNEANKCSQKNDAEEWRQKNDAGNNIGM